MVVSISKETISGFLEDKTFFHGAALAYYALFSLIPAHPSTTIAEESEFTHPKESV